MANLKLRDIKQINFCPYFYYQVNKLKIPYEPSEKTKFKEEMHNIVMYYIREVKHGKTPTEEKMRFILGKSFAKDAVQLKYKITEWKNSWFMRAAQSIAYLRIYSNNPDTWKDVAGLEIKCAAQAGIHVLDGVIDLVAKDSKENFSIIIPTLVNLSSISLDMDILFQTFLFRKRYKTKLPHVFIYRIDKADLVKVNLDAPALALFEQTVINIGNIMDQNYYERKIDQIKCSICYLRRDCRQ